MVKLSKKRIDEDEIRKQYGMNIKELNKITETLRGITYSGTKARLTNMLKKIKQIFKLQTRNNSTICNLNSNESENNSMEFM